MQALLQRDLGDLARKAAFDRFSPRQEAIERHLVRSVVVAMRAAQPTPTYHVLLVGIDDYAKRPLGGCVNDIDAVQRVLLSPKLGISKDRITRLASPRPGAHHSNEVASQPATLANLSAALVALSSSQVAAGDRVFIYYSGHGGRLEVVDDERRFHRESLLPVDFDVEPHGQGLLFDYELNQLLQQIAARTRSITVVLDCCHAAGLTRDGFADGDPQSRFVDLASVLQLTGPLPDPAHTAGPDTRAGHRGADSGGNDASPVGLARGVDDCHIVAASLGHELASENGIGGDRHGLFTRAFLAVLASVDQPTLIDVTWSRIWQQLRDELKRTNPWQNPWMAGNAARAVFAGPPVDGDAGFPVYRDGDDCRIVAGTLADVTIGAELAIYGDQPAYFPRLGSRDDLAARLGVIRVTSAERSTATASSVAAPFALPPCARGRIVKPGSPRQLGFAVVPPNPAIEQAIGESPLLVRVPPPGQPDVRLEQHGDQWFITDSVQGRSDEDRSLFALRSTELDCARAALEHYYDYARPLRLAEAAGDLPRSLTLSVLSCLERELRAADAQAARLPDAPSSTPGSYQLAAGARVCFRVHNGSRLRLRVTLVNAAASGKVQLLGDQIIDAEAHHVFWARNELGVPFQMIPPPGVAECADRLVAIGRTALDHDLAYLCVDRSFAQVIQRTRDAESFSKDIGDNSPRTIDHWTSAQTVIITRR